MNWIKNKYRQIKRTLEFLPIIWKGADYDYRYSIDLFKYQLERTADFLESDKAYSLYAKQDASRIRTATKLMEKVYEDEYGMEHLDIIKEKYGPSNFHFVELQERDSNGDPYCEMVESFEWDYTDSELLIIAEEKTTLLWESRAKQKRAHKILWDFIEHNIQRWWD